jgi:hypothetical protein
MPVGSLKDSGIADDAAAIIRATSSSSNTRSKNNNINNSHNNSNSGLGSKSKSITNLSRTGTGRSSFGIILKDKFQKNPNVYFPKVRRTSSLMCVAVIHGFRGGAVFFLRILFKNVF